MLFFLPYILGQHVYHHLMFMETKKETRDINRESLLVEVTGLEPATAWSQTRNATNCATPRLLDCGCKGTTIWGTDKGFVA